MLRLNAKRINGNTYDGFFIFEIPMSLLRLNSTLALLLLLLLSVALTPKEPVPCGAQTQDLLQRGDSDVPTALSSGC